MRLQGPPALPMGLCRGRWSWGERALSSPCGSLVLVRRRRGARGSSPPSGAVSPRTDPCELTRPLPAQRERRGEPRFEHARPCRVALAEEGGSSEPSPAQAAGFGSSGDRQCLTGEALAG